jgi:hypothetical protein
MNFIIYDATGTILRAGSCPEDEVGLQAQAGEFLIYGSADVMADAVDPVTQTVIPGGRAPAPVRQETYADVRRRLYPSLAEQFDMLWHAMDGNQTIRIEPFYSTIKAVKDAVPKTGEEIFEVGGL